MLLLDFYCLQDNVQISNIAPSFSLTTPSLTRHSPYTLNFSFPEHLISYCNILPWRLPFPLPGTFFLPFYWENSISTYYNMNHAPHIYLSPNHKVGFSRAESWVIYTTVSKDSAQSLETKRLSINGEMVTKTYQYMTATSRNHFGWNSKENGATSWHRKQNALKGREKVIGRYVHLMSRAQISFPVIFRELATQTAAHISKAQVYYREYKYSQCLMPSLLLLKAVVTDATKWLNLVIILTRFIATIYLVLKQEQNENIHSNWQRYINKLPKPELPTQNTMWASVKGKALTTVENRTKLTVIRKSSLLQDAQRHCPQVLPFLPPSLPWKRAIFLLFLPLSDWDKHSGQVRPFSTPTKPTAPSWKNIQGVAHCQLWTTNMLAPISFSQSWEYVIPFHGQWHLKSCCE